MLKIPGMATSLFLSMYLDPTRTGYLSTGLTRSTDRQEKKSLGPWFILNNLRWQKSIKTVQYATVNIAVRRLCRQQAAGDAEHGETVPSSKVT